MEHSLHVTPKDARSVLENSRGNRIHLQVAGVGSFIGYFGSNVSPWVIDGDFLCSQVNQVVPIEFIEEIAIFSESKEPTAPFKLNSILTMLDLANRTRPAFLESEESSQLYASGKRLRYSLQDRLPQDVKDRYKFPYLDTSMYTHYGIAAVKLGYHDGIRMPIPIDITASSALYMPSLRGEEFFQTPARFSGPVRLYADLDYLKNTMEIQKVSGGGFSLPIVGGGFSLSRAVVLGLQRIYDEINRRQMDTLETLVEGLDIDCKLVGYTSFPPMIKEEDKRIVLYYNEPAWQIEWREIEGSKYAIGVFHTRNVKTKAELKNTEWIHVLVNPECSKVTIDTLFSNSEALVVFATRKNAVIESRFGRSDYYLIMRYAEYVPGLEPAPRGENLQP